MYSLSAEYFFSLREHPTSRILDNTKHLLYYTALLHMVIWSRRNSRDVKQVRVWWNVPSSLFVSTRKKTSSSGLFPSSSLIFMPQERLVLQLLHCSSVVVTLTIISSHLVETHADNAYVVKGRG